jgi:predicted protein tyrosine phosphatase
MKLLTVHVYSRYGFEEVTKFTDKNVDEFPNEYFICVHATGWIHAIPYFKQPHKNVLNLVFDDVSENKKKWIHEYVPIPYNAIACTREQAKELKQFIDTIPNYSNIHVYCAKGQSRSPAIAAYIEEYKNKNTNSKFHTYKYNEHVYKLLKDTNA